MKYYLYLILAIAAELYATAYLKKANGFTVFFPSFIAVLGYTFAAYFLSAALKGVPIGTAYSIWASLGIVCSVLIGYFMYQEKIDIVGLVGILFILFGVILLTVFSKTTAS